MSALRQPSYRVTPSSTRSGSPYDGWRLFVVTPDYATLRRLQETLGEKFAGIEFEANGASARARMMDSFAPAFRMVMIDQNALNDKDVTQWRKTLSNMAQKPFLMLLSRDVDNAPLRWAAELGCIGILNVNGPMSELIRDLVSATMNPHPMGQAAPSAANQYKRPASSVFDKLHPEAAYLRNGAPPTAKASDYGIPLPPSILSQWPAIRPPLLPIMQDVTARIGQESWLAEAVLAAAEGRGGRAAAERVDSVEHAVERLGLMELSRLIPWFALHHEFGAVGVGEFAQTLWRYMVAGGLAFTLLREHTHLFEGYFKPSDLLLAGALRQSGMILMHRKHVDYRDMARAGFQSDINSVEQCTWEQKRYGITHSAISYAVASAWGIADELSEAVRLQHQIEALNQAPDLIQHVGKLFILSDALVAEWLFPNFAQSLVNEPVRKLVEEFRITLGELDDVRRNVAENFKLFPKTIR